MRFRWRGGSRSAVRVGLLLMISATVFVACTDQETDENEVFADAAQQVEQIILPDLVVESEAVLRNLLNALVMFPEICATPLSALGTFASRLPGVGRSDIAEFKDGDGSWQLTWFNVVLADTDDQLTSDTVPGMNMVLSIVFRSRAGEVLRGVPFALAPFTTLQLDGEPPSYAAGLTEGFFLSQERQSGQWQLRWRALGTPKVFEGNITVETVAGVVIKRIMPGEQNAVESLVVNTAANTITFQETTAVEEEKGITFFVRPGERLRFQLRLGPVGGSAQAITSEQLRIGAADQLLPTSLDPADFKLTSSLPIDPTGTPAFSPGVDLGTFIWQDTVTNGCNVGEDQWRLRFSGQAETATFTGTLSRVDDDIGARLISAQTVGSCPAGSLSDQRSFSYDCALTNNTEAGYDLCTSAGGRVNFTIRVNDRRDPSLVFVGASLSPPPSPLPFDLRFNLEMMEQQSARNLRFSDAIIVVKGNTEASESATADVVLNPDQMTFDPFCRGLGDGVQPQVRLTGEGEYGTARFDGSAYILDEVDQVRFTQANVETLTDIRRFPDVGRIRLITRVGEEIENSRVIAFMQDIQPVNGSVGLPVEAEINIDDVIFNFLIPREEIILTVE
jgi:hypothetical protein